MNPKISVVMSVYNQTAYVNLAVESILKQTFTNFEFIIIDDGSTDSTSRVLNRTKDKRIKLIVHQTTQGLAKSLNQAVKIAKGTYIARMDGDDIAFKSRLKFQLAFMEKNPYVAVCGTAVSLIDKSNLKIGEKHPPVTNLKIKSVLMRYNPIIHPTAMIRTKVLKKKTAYDENLNGAEDYDLWLKLGVSHDLANLPQVLLKYRVNPKGISWKTLKNTEFQAIKARMKALREYGYPRWQAIFLVKPLVTFLVPTWAKMKFFKIK